jgi:RimJ/RimL family protein N-acetyltransferase
MSFERDSPSVDTGDTTNAESIKFGQSAVLLNDGTQVVLRHALHEDAAALCEITSEMHQGREYSLGDYVAGPDDLKYQERFIEHCRLESGNLYVVAINDDQLAGYLLVHTKPFARIRHVATLSMYLRPPFRGVGLGKHLMRTALAWATAHPVLEKVILQVFSSNTPALRLYSQQGFAIEGRATRAVKFADGEYADLVSMFRFV